MTREELQQEAVSHSTAAGLGPFLGVRVGWNQS